MFVAMRRRGGAVIANLLLVMHQLLYLFIFGLFDDTVNNSEIYIKNQRDSAWAVCLLVTAIILYMFRTLFASILRST